MRAMPTRALRQWIARCMLVGFALALGAAAASPWVAPRTYQLVCADGVVKLMALGDDASSGTPPSHALDCALCLLTGTAPVDLRAAVAQPASPSPAPRWARVDAPQMGGAWAPLPARGPPEARA